MPKLPTYPILYDECKTIDISKLRGWGYLQPNQIKTADLSWTRNGVRTAWISILTNTIDLSPYIELTYNYNDKPINYRVLIIAKPSNIGKGFYLFFRCPHTGKLCRKLYLIGGYFYHRSAFRGCMYEKQTYSANKRQMHQAFDKVFGTEKHYEELNSKYFKTQYAKKPTNRYKRIWSKITAASKVSERELLSYIKR